jgi:hypothetical protein
MRIFDAGGTGTDGCGIYADCVDSNFSDLDVGSTASHGVYLKGSNNRLSNVKSWYCGSGAKGPHQGCGYYITGSREQISSCEAQDCKGDGWFVQGDRHVLAAVSADSNGHNGRAWDADGFYLDCNDSAIFGAAYDKCEGDRSAMQRYGVYVTSGSGLRVDVVTSYNRVDSFANATPRANNFISITDAHRTPAGCTGGNPNGRNVFHPPEG